MHLPIKAFSLKSGLVFLSFLLWTGFAVPETIAHPLLSQASSRSTRRDEAGRLLDQGIEQYQTRQYEAAIASWQAALEIFRAIGNRQGEAFALLNQGDAYLEISRYEDAIQVYNEALPIFRDRKDQKREAKALTHQGIAYSSLSRYEDAIRVHNEALSLYRNLKDRNGEALVLVNRGIAYFTLSRHEEAIRAFNEALPIFRDLKDRNGEASALMNRGAVYLEISRYEDANRAYTEALPIFRDLKDRNGEAQTLINQGNVYFQLSRYEEAIRAYTEALLIFQATKDRSNEAIALANRGNIYRDLALYKEALQDYDEALRIFRVIKDRNGEAFALANRGSAYFKLSRYEDAIRAYTEALPIFRAIKNRNGEASALMNRGTVYRSLSRYEDAIQAYNEALPIARSTRNRNSEATVLNNLGSVHFKRQQFVEAERSLRSAIAVHEAIRLDRLSEENKISLFETQARSYRLLEQVLIAQNQPETALTISEWGRSKALVERLSQQLQPSLSQTTSQAPTINALTQIARSQNATLVEYSLIYDDQNQATQLYIWVVQPSGKIAFRQVDLAVALPKQCSSIAQLVRNSRDSIGVRSPNSDWLVVDEKAQKNPCIQSDSDTNLKTLYQLLIEPIASLLPTDPNQHVVFIPDRTLFLVSFPALKAANGQFLIEKHTIRTTSSIQLLGKTRALKSQPKGQGALIVGNPFMPNDPTSIQAKQLSNLPNAEAEARAVALQLRSSLFNAQALIGKAGTKQTVIQQLAGKKIIHLATHGSFYDRNGLKSWLAFTPSKNDDGILTAEEVAQMKLSADLVVLSACDTGRGKVTGDGVIGLSRSFIAAGVPSVIVSLWAVPDAPTAELMKVFYQQLQQQPDKAQALRQAMLTTLKQHPNPKNWAAFTLIGEAQ